MEEEISVQDDDSDRDDNKNEASSAEPQTADQEEEGDAKESLFPDTSIDLQLTREGK